MPDPVVIAAILDELGYFDEKREDKKDEVDDEGRKKVSLRNNGEEEQKEK